MAGHSKWANIRFRKGKQDAQRGKVFTKLIREITVAARSGGPDTDNNPALRMIIDKALRQNMTKDTIQRAVSRGSGQNEGEEFFHIRYEGYGPSGVAVLVDCLTDNRNRTVGEVRHAFSKHGGSLGVENSVAYLFEKKGVIIIQKDANEEAVFEAAIEAGVEDVESDGNWITLECQADDFQTVHDQVCQHDWKIESSELSWIPSNKVTLSTAESESVWKMIDRLEQLDDVQSVHTNADFSDDFLQTMSNE